MRNPILEAAVLFVQPAGFGRTIFLQISRQLCLITLLILALSPSTPVPGQLTEVDSSAVVQEFLNRFDAITEQGFVPTLRAGDTGVGHTLEALLGLTENNDPGGDFHGMEVKAWRIAAQGTNLRRPMNLFLKEPQWLDRDSVASRIERFGYLDKNNRPAWYQSVTCRENSEGLCLQRDDDHAVLLLLDEADAIACWPYDVLAQRLAEKHKQAVYVGATTQGRGRSERFHYRSVVYCQHPSIDRFLHIVEQGDVIVELRMHVGSNGRARNHGTAFRIRKHRIQHLYASRQTLRPVEHGDD